jgi:hypothetical protein
MRSSVAKLARKRLQQLLPGLSNAQAARWTTLIQGFSSWEKLLDFCQEECREPEPNSSSALPITHPPVSEKTQLDTLRALLQENSVLAEPLLEMWRPNGRSTPNARALCETGTGCSTYRAAQYGLLQAAISGPAITRWSSRHAHQGKGPVGIFEELYMSFSCEGSVDIRLPGRRSVQEALRHFLGRLAKSDRHCPALQAHYDSISASSLTWGLPKAYWPEPEVLIQACTIPLYAYNSDYEVEGWAMMGYEFLASRYGDRNRFKIWVDGAEVLPVYDQNRIEDALAEAAEKVFIELINRYLFAQIGHPSPNYAIQLDSGAPTPLVHQIESRVKAYIGSTGQRIQGQIDARIEELEQLRAFEAKAKELAQKRAAEIVAKERAIRDAHKAAQKLAKKQEKEALANALALKRAAVIAERRLARSRTREAVAMERALQRAVKAAERKREGTCGLQAATSERAHERTVTAAERSHSKIQRGEEAQIGKLRKIATSLSEIEALLLSKKIGVELGHSKNEEPMEDPLSRLVLDEGRWSVLCLEWITAPGADYWARLSSELSRRSRGPRTKLPKSAPLYREPQSPETTAAVIALLEMRFFKVPRSTWPLLAQGSLQVPDFPIRQSSTLTLWTILCAEWSITSEERLWARVCSSWLTLPSDPVIKLGRKPNKAFQAVVSWPPKRKTHGR